MDGAKPRAVGVSGNQTEEGGGFMVAGPAAYRQVGAMPKKVKASAVRFIKLGREGGWEQSCIEGSPPCIRIGFRSSQHAESLAGDWTAVRTHWVTKGGKTPGKATEFTNQVRTFYTANEKTLWITFWRRKLWWAFAASGVVELKDGTRIRQVLGKWSSTDILGKDLLVENLSGALTKVQGFRGTICRVEESAYLLKRLNGEALLEVEAVVNAKQALEESVASLIRRLTWKDFELLADLVFTRAGWQRVSSLGKTQKTIDIELLSPVTSKRALVQVKSQADASTFQRYSEQFREMSQYDELFFVVHTPDPELADLLTEPGVHLLSGVRLAKLVVSSGLTDWLVAKSN